MIGPLRRLRAAATLGQNCPQMTQRPGNALYLQTFPASLSLSGVHGAAHKNSVWSTAGEGGKGSVHLDERENG